ncbi:MAG: TRAP transporter substrate-binding protein [Burkholderiaceae bacterium]
MTLASQSTVRVNRIRQAWAALVAGCALALALAPSAQAAAIEIDLASAYQAENFHTRNLQQFADDLEQASAGQLRLRVHPAGSLLAPAQIFDGVRAGKAQAGEVILSSLARQSPLFGIDALPFIVSGYDDARLMWQASRPEIEKQLAARGLQLLYAVPWPAQNLYSRREIRKVGDFKGLRMRTYDPATERIAQLIGAVPVTIQAVDLERAIAADELDLMITSSSTGVETQAWRRMGYYYRISAWIPKNVVFMDRRLFAALPEALKEQVLQAARAAEARGWKMSRQSDLDFEGRLGANRILIADTDYLVRGYLDRIGEKLGREWLRNAGNDELSVLMKYTTARAGWRDGGN